MPLCLQLTGASRSLVSLVLRARGTRKALNNGNKGRQREQPTWHMVGREEKPVQQPGRPQTALWP